MGVRKFCLQLDVEIITTLALITGHLCGDSSQMSSYDLFWLEPAVEQTVKLSVIRVAMTLMGRHCDTLPSHTYCYPSQGTRDGGLLKPRSLLSPLAKFQSRLSTF